VSTVASPNPFSATFPADPAPNPDPRQDDVRPRKFGLSKGLAQLLKRPQQSENRTPAAAGLQNVGEADARVFHVDAHLVKARNGEA